MSPSLQYVAVHFCKRVLQWLVISLHCSGPGSGVIVESLGTISSVDAGMVLEESC